MRRMTDFDVFEGKIICSVDEEAYGSHWCASLHCQRGEEEATLDGLEQVVRDKIELQALNPEEAGREALERREEHARKMRDKGFW